MNLSALPELLLAWVKNQGAALLQGDRTELQATQFRPGAQYEGKVLDNLSSGRHLVQVAGQKLDMALPRSTQPGDTVRLTFLAGGPRPTFLLNQTAAVPNAQASQPVSLSSSAQQVNALMRLAGPAQSPSAVAASQAVISQAETGRVATPQAMTGQAATSQAASGQAASGQAASGQAASGQAASGRAAISQAATGLAAISQAATSRVATGQAAVAAKGGIPAGHPVGSPTPTASSASPPSASVARAVANPAALPVGAASTTGPVAATRPIVANVVMLQSYSASVQFTPAGAVSPNTALVGQAVDGLRASIPSSTTLNPNVLAELPEPSSNLLPTRLFQTLSESGLFYEAHLARWTKGELSFEAVLREPQALLGREGNPKPGIAELGGMPDEAARLAGRQLHLLEGAPFVWQGFAWPGQWLEWLVRERQPGDGEGGTDDESAQWVTELSLTLPRMGTIHARVGLNGERLSLRLSSPDETTQEDMRAALPLLVKGLEAAGLRPVSLSVESSGVPA